MLNQFVCDLCGIGPDDTILNAVLSCHGVIKVNRRWSFIGGASWIGEISEIVVRCRYVQLANSPLAEGGATLQLALIITGPNEICKTLFLNNLIVRIEK